jgi:hypothetical protein
MGQRRIISRGFSVALLATVIVGAVGVMPAAASYDDSSPVSTECSTNRASAVENSIKYYGDWSVYIRRSTGCHTYWGLVTNQAGMSCIRLFARPLSGCAYARMKRMNASSHTTPERLETDGVHSVYSWQVGTVSGADYQACFRLPDSLTVKCSRTKSQADIITFAKRIRDNTTRITLATTHVDPRGANDGADPSHEIADLAAGKGVVKRSCYGTAPCGTIPVYRRVLTTLDSIAKKHTIKVSEIAGGEHHAGSLHYQGRAVDISYVDGNHVIVGQAAANDVVAICKAAGAAGATTVERVRGSAGQIYDHVHCEWPA